MSSWLNIFAKSPQQPKVIGATYSFPSHFQLLTQPSTALEPQRQSQHDKRDLALTKQLASSLIDLSSLQTLCWHGISSLSNRSTAWQVLLHYLPVQKSRQRSTCDHKRTEYATYVQSIYQGPELNWSILKQITKDVERTRPEFDLFRLDSVQALLRRLLYILAIRNPASSYVQGINELSVPFLVAFFHEYFDFGSNIFLEEVPENVLLEIEADTYWCMYALMRTLHEFFTQDMPGVQRAVRKIDELLTKVDKELAEHMQNEGLEATHYAYRWVSCLMVREFPLNIAMRVWDTLLCEDSYIEFCVFFSLAILKKLKNQLICRPFGEMLVYLQNLSGLEWKEADIELLMADGFYLKNLYQDSHRQSRATQRRATAVV